MLVLEAEAPCAIRREAAFCEAVYEGSKEVEGVLCERADSVSHACRMLKEGRLPILADPQGKAIMELKPEVVVDAILAKKNLGTNRKMAFADHWSGTGIYSGAGCGCGDRDHAGT